MSGDAWLVVAVLVAAFALFVTEVIAVDLVGLLVMIALVLGGVLGADEALAGFGNSALLTVASMFVLSAGLIRTGALDWVTHAIAAASRGNRRLQIGLMFTTVAFVSAFMNNTPVVIIFMPVVLGMSNRLGLSPSKLLIPLSFATILGGTCTVIGTSTNLLVSQAAVQAGYHEIGMFDFSGPGVLYAITGLGFLGLLGSRLLPVRASVSSAGASGALREFVTEISFPLGSPLVGKSYQEVLGRTAGIVPLMVIRGEETYPAPFIANPHTQFIRAGDVVLLKGIPGAINLLLKKEGVALPPELGEAVAAQGRGKAVTMVECVITPNSALLGRTLAGTAFSRRHGNASVLAILRRDEHLRERVAEIRLQLGDTLLVVVDEGNLDALRNTDEFVLLEGVERHVRRKDKAVLAATIMAGVILISALEIFPISILAIVGSLLMVLTGCLPLRLAYNSIDLPVLVLIAGMLALAKAFDRTGLVELSANTVMTWLEPHGPRAVMAGVFLLSTVVTAIASNNAVAVLFTPIAIQIGHTMGLDPSPFIYAVLFGASCDFCTPIGYQTNLFVYGPGGYRFMDYVRIGAPLTLALFVVVMIVVPWWFPFVPAAP